MPCRRKIWVAPGAHDRMLVEQGLVLTRPGWHTLHVWLVTEPESKWTPGMETGFVTEHAESTFFIACEPHESASVRECDENNAPKCSEMGCQTDLIALRNRPAKPRLAALAPSFGGETPSANLPHPSKEAHAHILRARVCTPCSGGLGCADRSGMRTGRDCFDQHITSTPYGLAVSLVRIGAAHVSNAPPQTFFDVVAAGEAGVAASVCSESLEATNDGDGSEWSVCHIRLARSGSYTIHTRIIYRSRAAALGEADPQPNVLGIVLHAGMHDHPLNTHTPSSCAQHAPTHICMRAHHTHICTCTTWLCAHACAYTHGSARARTHTHTPHTRS